jgi:hypothetical protein
MKQFIYKTTILEHIAKCPTCKDLSDQCDVLFSTHASRFGKHPGDLLTQQECNQVFANCHGCRMNYFMVMETIKAHIESIGVFMN